MDEKKKDPSDEAEIRPHREFSLADAIGEQAGGDLLKGASPVTRQRQAELEIEHYLENHLVDVEGALATVLLRHVAGGPQLIATDFADPLAVLKGYCEQLLESELRLRDFVIAVDAEWGHVYGERPYFEHEGQEPHCDDPYTLAAVRSDLERLVAELRESLG